MSASPGLIDAMTKRGNDPTPPVMQAVKQEEDSLSPESPTGAEPNPLAGTRMWLDLASSMKEQARQPEATMLPHQLHPASLPDDFDLLTAVYAGVRALRSKVESFCRLLHQTAGSKRAVAAAWFAEQDIRTLCETFENPIAGIPISGGRVCRNQGLFILSSFPPLVIPASRHSRLSSFPPLVIPASRPFPRRRESI